MTPEQRFVGWLRGFLEAFEAANAPGLPAEGVALIKKKLSSLDPHAPATSAGPLQWWQSPVCGAVDDGLADLAQRFRNADSYAFVDCTGFTYDEILEAQDLARRTC